MAVTNYFTVNGEIFGEETAGTQTDYLTDALGSVTATVDQNAAVVNTYRYKPYGAQLAKTGVGADPKFRWVGVQGYRQTAREFSDVYVRARHYATVIGRWTAPDPLRPRHPSYEYVRNAPTSVTDPTGLIPQVSPDCECLPPGSKGVQDCVAKFCEALKGGDRGRILQCIIDKIGGGEDNVIGFIRCMDTWCARNDTGIFCFEKGHPLCPEEIGWCWSHPIIICGVRIRIPYPVTTTPCAGTAGTNKPFPEIGIAVCCDPYSEEFKKKCPNPIVGKWGFCDPLTVWLHELGHICSVSGDEDALSAFQHCVKGVIGC